MLTEAEQRRRTSGYSRSSHVVGLSLLVFLTLALLGCQGERQNTFAGFTYGGGGKTFSAEPALLLNTKEGFRLRSGSDRDPTFLEFRSPHSSLNLKESLEVADGSVRVSDTEEVSTITSGTVVIQSRINGLVHGSFDLQSQQADGREYLVVGSFTAAEGEAQEQVEKD